ncbi:3'-5' exonuclease [Blastochloris tepida]|uniref:3'-5' exonuclease n=1 Tax=Blastochloris tepida TaxID=2233851 RepID=A0A348FZQ3_9HYPH|nr:3'-5' exonuclease [Blastochloris tepida]BBF92786.1 3'-5' exonuclease [Blastochloris tepida]
MPFRPLVRLIDRLAMTDRRYAVLFGKDTSGEAVAIDCETTGLDPWQDEIIAVAAIPIRDGRILTSARYEALVRPTGPVAATSIKIHQLREMDLAAARPIEEVLPELMTFIGRRPLVGYYLEFDVAMLNRYLLSFANIHVPNPQIEVSRLYYERKFGDAPPGTEIDLRFATIAKDLGIPDLPAHDAFNDALATAMMYVKLVDYRARNIRISRMRDFEAE